MKKATPFLLALLIACANPVDVSEEANEKNHEIIDGSWLFSLELEQGVIPFNAEFKNSPEGLKLTIFNAEEKIDVSDITRTNDSLFIQMPLYNSRFEALLVSDSLIEGQWVNYNRGSDYKIPFSAIYNLEKRFAFEQGPVSDYSGKWEVKFSPDSVDYCKAVGVFYQEGQSINGTFLTETGDYRYLEGVVDGNKLLLSTFDGSHAFLFTAEMDDSGNVQGGFWSGSHWYEKWEANRNATYELTHPDSLTFAKKESDLSGMVFLDHNKERFVLDGPQFDNKVLIVQIMGTWCPNCVDESREFSQLYDKYKDEGLEIVAVSYERTDDIDEAYRHINRLQSHLGINYPFVFGGKAKKSKVSEDFHMLNKVISYPTAIFVDRTGSIRKIHTGFYGPGTGDYYLKFQKNLIDFVELLLSEKTSS